LGRIKQLTPAAVRMATACQYWCFQWNERPHCKSMESSYLSYDLRLVYTYRLSFVFSQTTINICSVTMNDPHIAPLGAARAVPLCLATAAPSLPSPRRLLKARAAAGKATTWLRHPLLPYLVWKGRDWGWGRGGWIRGKKGRGKADADVNTP
jgi:hypothetical protein